MAAKPPRPGSRKRDGDPHAERRGRSRSIPNTRHEGPGLVHATRLPNLAEEEDDEETEFARPAPWILEDAGYGTPSPPGEFTQPDLAAVGELDTDALAAFDALPSEGGDQDHPLGCR